MNKEELLKAIANDPDNIEIEIAVLDGNKANTLRRQVIRVERRSDKAGKEYLTLICLKSLKEQLAQTKTTYAKAKQIAEEKSKAAAEEALKNMGTPEISDMELKPMELKPMPTLVDAADIKPIDLKPMPGVKQPTHTFAELPELVKEILERTETDEQAQADSPDLNA